MRNVLWGVVALLGWLALVAAALCVTTPGDEKPVAMVDAVIAVIAGVSALVGALLFVRSRVAVDPRRVAVPPSPEAAER
ncbi:hypothetical protein [Leifsonia xyli]|nr:hypothetical protein [Leifsonia xyli]